MTLLTGHLVPGLTNLERLSQSATLEQREHLGGEVGARTFNIRTGRDAQVSASSSDRHGPIRPTVGDQRTRLRDRSQLTTAVRLASAEPIDEGERLDRPIGEHEHPCQSGEQHVARFVGCVIQCSSDQPLGVGRAQQAPHEVS